MFECCRTSSHWIFRVIADICLLLLDKTGGCVKERSGALIYQDQMGIPVLVFYLHGAPFKRGFFCGDDSLRYPYRESTIQNWLLYCFGFVIPLGTIIITECVISKFSDRSNGARFWEAYDEVLTFLFGAGCTQLVTDVGKYTVGRLRPHFFAVCSPDVDCDDPDRRHVYIEDFECRGKDSHLLKDMRLSFPSGHSSLSAYSMVFVAMYCGAKFSGTCMKWVKHVIQFFVVVLAFYTGLTRVSDYKHHWSDVLAGLALGTLTAIIIVLFVSDLYPHRRSTVAADRSSELEDIELTVAEAGSTS